MGTSSLAGAVQRYYEQGLAPSTQRTYAAASKRFFKFCSEQNIFTPFPVCEYSMCLFAAHLAEEGLSPQTVKSYSSAVRNLQVSLGFSDPRDSSSLPVLKRVLAGISRVYTSTNKAKKPRLPITIQVLAGIHAALAGLRDHDNILLWAIAASAFFGFFRLGELLPASPGDYNPASSLSWGDVAVNSRAAPSMVKFHLRRSKCDQVGKGVDVVVGRTGTDLCPVHAIVAYISFSHAIGFCFDERSAALLSPRMRRSHRTTPLRLPARAICLLLFPTGRLSPCARPLELPASQTTQS